MITDAIKAAYKSERLHYKRINEDDNEFKAFLTELFQDPEVHALTTTMLMRPVGNNEIQYLMREYASALLGVAICHHQTTQDGGNKPVMIGELVIGEGGIPGSVAHNRNASVGIAIASQYQGRGYGREALRWAVDWAFRHGGLHSVSISTAAFNTRAAKLYRDMGFVEEGRRREVLWFDGGWHDELLFSVTEEEWRGWQERGKSERGKSACEDGSDH